VVSYISKNLKKVLIFFILISTVFLFLALPVSAQNALGGRILFSLPCTNGGFALTVGPPKGGIFLYQLGVSTLYREYQLRPGPWALGSFSYGGICVVGVPPFGFPLFTLGTIKKIGTSFF
jgi:hypothetical protein